MKIQNQISQVVETFGDVSSTKASISASKLAKLQYILTEGLYKDPVSATIVELTNNGMDAVIESGKNPIENPVIVNLEYNKMSIEDKGIGMSQEFFENTFMCMLESTKEDNDNVIGHFGKH
jgi:hypothetical protein